MRAFLRESSFLLLAVAWGATLGASPTVRPDQYLRGWTPLTLEFETDRGPRTPGVEQAPESYFQIQPETEGLAQWIDRRTLRFRPARPWAPGRDFQVRVGSKLFSRESLLLPPSGSEPRPFARELPGLDRIVLEFEQEVSPETLEERLSFQVEDNEALTPSEPRVLLPGDFQVQALERANAQERPRYAVTLSQPLSQGRTLHLALRLSKEPGQTSLVHRWSYHTQESFRLVRAGVSWESLPLSRAGTQYDRSQALVGSPGFPELSLNFTRPPADLDPVVFHDLLRLVPRVADLEWRKEGKVIRVTGTFRPETIYRVELHPTALLAQDGEPLQLDAASRYYFRIAAKPRHLAIRGGQHTLESFGPKAIPLEGRSVEELDVVVHRVDAQDRDLWPFSSQALSVEEGPAPPLPGEEPKSTESFEGPSDHVLRQRLRTLSTPWISRLVKLPLKENDRGRSFGLDLEPLLQERNAAQSPGTYLVGVRDLVGSTQRQWTRVQVTDLALTSLDFPDEVRFFVTSLKTGEPRAKAEVVVEGTRGPRHDRWETLFRKTTGSDGSVAWFQTRAGMKIRRISVQLGEDRLVLDPDGGSKRYRQGIWSRSRGPWLKEAIERDRSSRLVHLFSERPLYRPGEPVHLKGIVRDRSRGKFSIDRTPLELHVLTPRGKRQTFPIRLSDTGSFYLRYEEPDEVTGVYNVQLREVAPKKSYWSRKLYASMSFRKEAYRVPRFEVETHGPTQVGADKAFELETVARYYAGGNLEGSRVRFRQTHMPFAWVPKDAPEGFAFASSARYSDRPDAGRTIQAVTYTKTDAHGAAKLILDPATFPDARPRRTVVEATVFDRDGATVSDTHTVEVLPAFVLGLKSPRYLAKAQEVKPELLALGPEGKLRPGVKVQLRLLKKRWHSYLRAADYSSGLARYRTEEVEEVVQEVELTTGSKAVSQGFSIQDAGIYVLEARAQDALGRSQSVRLDFYAAGQEAVAWRKPRDQGFEVSLVEPEVDPGETARFVLQSPFQEARCLVVVEGPEENHLRWIEVEGGQASFSWKARAEDGPELPVHFVLLRRRLAGVEPDPDLAEDLGKPQVLSSSVTLKVSPKAHLLDVSLEHPKEARPGQTLEVAVSLKDGQGRPLSGEVTLWLVDQAVLALAPEVNLDPKKDFLPPRLSSLALRDTRTDLTGSLPLLDLPGGGARGAKMARRGLEDRVSVRKNFQTVPYFEPRIRVPASGTTTVKVHLPDNLTNFKLRAKAVHGADRFGLAKSSVSVRLPVVLQASLPRFLRASDQVSLGAIARVVSGPSGAGTLRFRAQGAGISLEKSASLELSKQSQELRFPLDLGPHAAKGQGPLEVEMQLLRTQDQAGDAFQFSIPVLEDRSVETRTFAQKLSRGEPFQAPRLPSGAKGLERVVRLASQSDRLELAEAGDYLIRYPFGCTEQRISRLRGILALEKLQGLDALGLERAEVEDLYRETMDWIFQATQSGGLVSFWPASEGSIVLTAYVLDFLTDAKELGREVPKDLEKQVRYGLTRVLRSDAVDFVEGEAFLERCVALRALARVGDLDRGYLNELSRRALAFDVETRAEILLALIRAGEAQSLKTARLVRSIHQDLIFRPDPQGLRFAGLQNQATHHPLVLSDSTRTQAQVLRALAQLEPNSTKVVALRRGLLEAAGPGGWGSTYSNAHAVLALSETDGVVVGPGAESRLSVRLGGRSSQEAIRPEDFFAHRSDPDQDLRLELRSGSDLYLRGTDFYLPAESGDQAKPRAQGFRVSRVHWSLDAEGNPTAPFELTGGSEKTHTLGDWIEEEVVLEVAEDQGFVALEIPLAAGFEYANPKLDTTPREARPKAEDSLRPSYSSVTDDRVMHFFDWLPAGTHRFYFRTKATTPGSFVQPAARAQAMYKDSRFGTSGGVRLKVEPESP